MEDEDIKAALEFARVRNPYLTDLIDKLKPLFDAVNPAGQPVYFFRQPKGRHLRFGELDAQDGHAAFEVVEPGKDVFELLVMPCLRGANGAEMF